MSPDSTASWVRKAGKKTSMLLVDVPLKTLMCRFERQIFRLAHAKEDVKSEHQFK
jgi:hypothetical protein